MQAILGRGVNCIFVKSKIISLYIAILLISTLILTLESSAYIAPPPPSMGKGSIDSDGKSSISSSQPSGTVTSTASSLSRSASGYSYSSSSSNRGYQTYNYYNNNNSAFLIYKSIESKENECFLNNDINITVRVKCQPSGRLDDVLLKEEVSSGCTIVKNSSRYITISDPINESINVLDQNKWKIFEKTDTSFISTKIPTINPGTWIKYIYTIRPVKAVWHNLDTIIKYYDYTKKDSYIPDFSYSLDRIFVASEIPLHITLYKNKTHAAPGENILLLYEIKYMGDNQDNLPLEVELNQNMNYYKCNNSSKSHDTINKLKSVRFSRIINFSVCDEYAVPNLKINGIPYEINSRDYSITVESWEKRNYDNIYWAFQVLGLIIAFALGFREFRNLEKSLHRIGIEIGKVRHLAEKYDEYLRNLKSGKDG